MENPKMKQASVRFNEIKARLDAQIRQAQESLAEAEAFGQELAEAR